jgi:hypothetical protein
LCIQSKGERRAVRHHGDAVLLQQDGVRREAGQGGPGQAGQLCVRGQPDGADLVRQLGAERLPDEPGQRRGDDRRLHDRLCSPTARRPLPSGEYINGVRKVVVPGPWGGKVLIEGVKFGHMPKCASTIWCRE